MGKGWFALLTFYFKRVGKVGSHFQLFTLRGWGEPISLLTFNSKGVGEGWFALLTFNSKRVGEGWFALPTFYFKGVGEERYHF